MTLPVLKTNYITGNIKKEELLTYIIWSAGQITRLKKQASTINSPNHPGNKKQILTRELLIRLEKHNFNKHFLQFVTNNPELLKDANIMNIIKHNFESTSKILNNTNQLNKNEIEFLDETIKLLNQVNSPENIEQIKERIKRTIAEIYKDEKVFGKLSRLTEKIALREIEVLDRFSHELKSDKLDLTYLVSLRREINDRKLADSIEKISAELPSMDVLPILSRLPDKLSPDGSNLLYFIEWYENNKKSIIDKKTLIKFNNIVENTYAYIYFNEIWKRINLELRGGFGGKWYLLTKLSDKKIMSEWIKKLNVGHALNNNDLRDIGVSNHLLIGKRIKDKDIARLMAEIMNKEPREKEIRLQRFIGTRLSFLAKEIIIFTRQRINEIPIERKERMNAIIKMVDKKLAELKKTEEMIRKKIIKVVSDRKEELERDLEKVRKRWYPKIKDRLDEYNQNFEAVKGLLNRVALAEEMLLVYLGEYVNPEKREKLIKPGSTLVKYVRDIANIYNTWYEDDAYGAKVVK